MNTYLLTKKYKKEALDSLLAFLKIPSVYDETSVAKNCPFGKDVDASLKFVGALGEKLGFKVDYCDGFATELSIGSGDKLIGIYAHADVVPATGNWKFDPFTPTIVKNRLYARGTSDDKGPLIAALYAVKALFDKGLIKDYRVKIVVGGDEERGSSCLDYYFDTLKKEYATYGFTPDSDFPLIYGEKGIVDFFPKIDIKLPHNMKIKGGIVTNAVCDKVEVTMEKDTPFFVYLTNNNINHTLEDDENGVKVTFIGKSVHGSTPEGGVNAALIALNAIGEFYHFDNLVDIAQKLNDTSGKSFGLFESSKLLKDTTFCVGMISSDENSITFSVNFRFPEVVDYVKTIKKFDETFHTISSYGEPSPYLLFDPKCKMVKALLKAYRCETLDFSKPLTTGGGTYAKHAKNTVAFGALFPYETSSMHEVDESINLKDFYLSMQIYARAIYYLGKLNEN